MSLTSCVLGRDENEEDKVIFKGWARMALPLQAFSVVEVRKPNVGQNKPASVRADILLDTKRTFLLLHCCSKCWDAPVIKNVVVITPVLLAQYSMPACVKIDIL